MKIYNISEIPEGLRVPSYEEVLLSGYTDGYEDGYDHGKEYCKPYEEMYFTIEAMEAGNIPVPSVAKWRVNKGEWQGPFETGTMVPVEVGDKIEISRVRNTADYMFSYKTGMPRYKAYGNAMSLVWGDDFRGKTAFPSQGGFGAMVALFESTKIVYADNLVLPATDVPTAGYEYMFNNCSLLVAAPELPATGMSESCYLAMFTNCTSLTTAPAIPADTLANTCYQVMFSGCYSLVNAPELPATNLAELCYGSMFANCTSLESAPELPAMTLANSCYSGMFQGCTALTDFPDLPATALTENCYSNMFDGCSAFTGRVDLPAPTLVRMCYYRMFRDCTGISYIKCMATDISAENCTYNWLYRTNNTGTFEHPCGVPWTRDENGIPNGWTIIDGCLHPENEYMTFDIIIGGTIMWSKNDGAQTNILNYQINDGDWQSLTPTTGGSSFQVSAGDVVKFKGEFVGDPNYNQRHYNTFSGSTAVFEASGNVMSLVWGDSFVGKTSFQSGNQIRIFSSLFQDLTGLTSIENLVLPATTLSNACYTGMFAGCTAVTKAPVLPAETLTISCYRWMFSGCTALNEVTCLATSITATQATQYWLDGVASTGIFYNECGPDWSRDASGVPSGWTMHTECAPDYSTMYFTVEVLSYSNVTIPAHTKWRVNGGTWNDSASTETMTVASEGDKIEMSKVSVDEVLSLFYNKTMPTQYKVYGNIMSLIWGDNFTVSTGFNGCTFYVMFRNQSGLIDAENLVLPEANLVSACYNGMFRGCVKITKSPVLPAKTLVQSCYSRMFQGCTKLAYVKCLASEIEAGASSTTQTWLDGVAESGTFVRSIYGNIWTTGVEGIPNGWTVEYSDEP